VLVVLALVFVFIKFPSCKGTPSQQQQLPTESMGPTLKRLFAIPRFRLGILSQFLYVGAQVGVWSFTIRFVQLVQQGTSEHSATYWLLASLVIYAVGKTVATWLMNRLNPALLLGTFARPPPPFYWLPYSAVQCWRSMRSFWSASVWRHAGRQTLVWSSKGWERYPDRRLDRGDVDYRRGRYSAGDGHYLGYERRQYANRLYRSACVLCVCRFLRFLVRA
jgi:hypothetical protein